MQGLETVTEIEKEIGIVDRVSGFIWWTRESIKAQRISVNRGERNRRGQT